MTKQTTIVVIGRLRVKSSFCDGIHLVDFLPFLHGRQLLGISVSFPAHQAPSEKKFTLKGKNLLPWGANSFLLE